MGLARKIARAGICAQRKNERKARKAAETKKAADDKAESDRILAEMREQERSGQAAS